MTKHTKKPVSEMRYQIIKVRNGLFRLEWEDGVKSEHSTSYGAEKAVLNRIHVNA